MASGVSSPEFKAGFGLAFADLYERDGLVKIDRAFVQHLGDGDQALANRLLAARAEPGALEAKAESDLLIELGPHLEDFLAKLFAIEEPVRALQARHHALAPLYTVKRLFVQRRAAKAVSADAAQALDPAAPLDVLQLHELPGTAEFELAFARAVTAWEQDEVAHADRLAAAQSYAAWALHTEQGRRTHGRGVLFQIVHKTDPLHLVPVETIELHGVTMLRLA